ncbi:MAG: hypothetical protein JJE45_00230 [Prolixibacteraceae bacterium]|nr:hypothetical protein [Prolixibacteraceae bacterium]
MTNYTAQAETFAQKHGVKLSFIGDPEYKIHFAGDKTERYVFKCRLTRAGKSYTFDFGQSIKSGAEEPTLYDVLTCLQKYDVGDFENFCSDFGYDTDSRTAERTYKAVCKEFAAVERLFSDIIEELQEIQ